MRPILHLAGKDLRRLAWAIVAWIGIGVVLRVLAWRACVATPWVPKIVDNVQACGIALTSMHHALLAVLLVALVVEDPLAGDRAFWVTRPVGGGTLLGAKLVAMLAGLVAPAAMVEMAWLVWGGANWSEAWGGVVPQLGSWGVTMLGAMGVTVWLGRGESRPLVWLAAGIGAMGLLGGYLVARAMPETASVEAGEWPERLDLALWVALAALVVAVGAQYLQRRAERSLLIWAVGVILGIAVWWGSPWTWRRGEWREGRELPAADELRGWATVQAARWTRAQTASERADDEIIVPLKYGPELATGRWVLTTGQCRGVWADRTWSLPVRLEEADGKGGWQPVPNVGSRRDGAPVSDARLVVRLTRGPRPADAGLAAGERASGRVERLVMQGLVWQVEAATVPWARGGQTGWVDRGARLLEVVGEPDKEWGLEWCTVQWGRAKEHNRPVFALVGPGAEGGKIGGTFRSRFEIEVGGLTLGRGTQWFTEAEGGAKAVGAGARSGMETWRLECTRGRRWQAWWVAVDVGGSGRGP